jgi:hypothetical protein
VTAVGGSRWGDAVGGTCWEAPRERSCDEGPQHRRGGTKREGGRRQQDRVSAIKAMGLELLCCVSVYPGHWTVPMLMPNLLPPCSFNVLPKGTQRVTFPRVWPCLSLMLRTHCIYVWPSTQPALSHQPAHQHAVQPLAGVRMCACVCTRSWHVPSTFRQYPCTNTADGSGTHPS